jgi:hypothetical protein
MNLQPSVNYPYKALSLSMNKITMKENMQGFFFVSKRKTTTKKNPRVVFGEVVLMVRKDAMQCAFIALQKFQIQLVHHLLRFLKQFDEISNNKRDEKKGCNIRGSNRGRPFCPHGENAKI